MRRADTVTTAQLRHLDDLELCARGVADQLEVGFSEFDPRQDLDMTRLSKNKMWQTGRFVVRGIEPYKNGMYLGVDLSHPENEALREERNQIIHEFLKQDQKLPVRHIDPNFDPHAEFFRGTQPVSQIIVPALLPPPEITLGKPEAIVNFKK